MTSKKDDEVGYGKPPKDTRFQPGKSGNPNGRPKKKDEAPSQELNLWKLLDTPRTVYQDGKPTKKSNFEIELLQLARKALTGKGNIRDIRRLIKRFERYEAITQPAREVLSGHVILPKGLPSDLSRLALERHGRPPWSAKQLTPLVEEYLAHREEVVSRRWWKFEVGVISG